jgi:hypothetical protein
VFCSRILLSSFIEMAGDDTDPPAAPGAGAPAVGTALAPRVGGGRLIERRSHSRVRPMPDELFRLFAALSPLLDLARAALLGAGRMARRARLEAVPRRDRVPPAAGQVVRLRGRVEAPGATGFETPGTTEPVLFARSIYLVKSAFRRSLSTSYADETRGLDFAIRLPSGESVQLAAPQVRLHDAPRRVTRPNLAELGRRGGQCERTWLLGLPPFVREVAIRAGDTVETAGMLVREVGPQGDGPLGRGTPLVVRLVPPPGTPYLWVRLV